MRRATCEFKDAYAHACSYMPSYVASLMCYNTELLLSLNVHKDIFPTFVHWCLQRCNSFLLALPDILRLFLVRFLYTLSSSFTWLVPQKSLSFSLSMSFFLLFTKEISPSNNHFKLSVRPQEMEQGAVLIKWTGVAVFHNTRDDHQSRKRAWSPDTKTLVAINHKRSICLRSVKTLVPSFTETGPAVIKYSADGIQF